MTGITLEKVISDLQMIRDSAIRKAYAANSAGKLQEREYWTGQADGLADAIGMLQIAKGVINDRITTGKDEQ